MDLRELRYGIEIETVKRTREQITWAIHSVVGGHVSHIGAPSCYDPWEVEDLRSRKWKVVNDTSLTNVPSHLRAELVSPVLTHDDLCRCVTAANTGRCSTPRNRNILIGDCRLAIADLKTLP